MPPTKPCVPWSGREKTQCANAAMPATHLRWLATPRLEHAAQQIASQEYLHSFTEASTHITRLEQALYQGLT